MSVLSKLYTFLAGGVIQPAEVNVNFDDIIDYVNDEVVLVDGTKAMTAHLAGPATDPTSANQYSRKAFVDAGDKARLKENGSAAWSGYTASPDPSAVQLLFAAETAVRVLDGSGNAALTFPTAFPNHIISVIVTNGDLNATPGYFNVGSVSQAGFAVNGQHPSGTSMAGATVRFNYIAVGY